MSRSRQRLRATRWRRPWGSRAAAAGRPTRRVGRRPRMTLRPARGMRRPGRPSDGGERFAARVGRLSGGRLKIKIAWEAGGPGRAAP
jgi:hypothetical protein